MKLKYHKRALRINLYLGTMWLVFGFIMLSSSSSSWISYPTVLFGILYFAHYFYMLKTQYITIENGFVFKNTLHKNKLLISDIIDIHKYAGDYTLTTANSKLVINTRHLDVESLKLLDLELNTLAIN
ncbi:hypothetical protein BZARG_684 [Bizionia argentinensis JUB59]|uniref:PH domain-containing protein n=1 Tax=Bizionia argentinensis JUB59 TaxID=1046627 RepID=G2EB02_9FLAO|nr:hypothetical protein [Bizionia argentinensis]EGV44448.1 hypothetical protein BZARG_684 [Bizionia argentinensis JUB59]